MNASYTKSTFENDALVVGNHQIQTQKVTIPDGTAALLRGTVLGKIAVGALTSELTGTGNGTLSGLVAKTKTIAGDYKLTCVAAASNGGRFSVTAPDGTALQEALVGVAYANDHLGFTINDGATDFVVGDEYVVTVAAGSGKYIKSVAAAVDGSQIPDLILAEDVPALDGADGEALAYLAGDFLSSELTLGAGHTVASIKAVMQDKGIFLV